MKKTLEKVIIAVFLSVVVLLTTTVIKAYALSNDVKIGGIYLLKYDKEFDGHDSLHFELSGIRKDLWVDICYYGSDGKKLSECWKYNVPYNKDTASDHVEKWSAYTWMPDNCTRVTMETEDGMLGVPISEVDVVKEYTDNKNSEGVLPNCTCLCTADKDVTVADLDEMIKQLEEHKKVLTNK